MPDILTRLQKSLKENTLNKTKTPLHCLSVYQCYKPQMLHRVPFNQPTLLMVAKGHKEVEVNSLKMTVRSGGLLLIPSDTTVWLGQYPDNEDRQYLGLAFRFDFEALKHFRLIYGSSLEQWDISAQWQSKTPDSILASLEQWVNWEKYLSADSQLIHHRQVELLLLLAQEGLVGNILLGEHPSWKQRVSQLLAINPAQSWQIGHVCSRLAVSESSLRRKLQAEDCSFRELLEDVRLTSGLSMLLETPHPIGQIAMSVGYQSQSRFGERFKQRFGMTPTELRRTLDA